MSAARSIPPRVLVTVVATLALLGLGWFWLRDSSLVAVTDVNVTGVSGPDAARITSVLEDTAHDQTTLHVSAGDLRTAVSAYPQVKDIRISTHFPHRMDITVIEHNPVAVLVADGKRIPVSGDGHLLRAVQPGDIATVQLSTIPGGDLLRDPTAGHAVTMLAAAPSALRDRVQNVWTGSNGLTARMKNGPLLYFGNDDRLAAKWAAVTRVLEDPEAAGALYLDVRIPERTAAGGLAAPSTGQASSGG